MVVKRRAFGCPTCGSALHLFRSRPAGLTKVRQFRMFECLPCDTVVITAEFIFKTSKRSESKRYLAWAG